MCSQDYISEEQLQYINVGNPFLQ